jgi:hypothetical protein
MAFDEGVAQRIREVLTGQPEVVGNGLHGESVERFYLCGRAGIRRGSRSRKVGGDGPFIRGNVASEIVRF